MGVGARAGKVWTLCVNFGLRDQNPVIFPCSINLGSLLKLTAPLPPIFLPPESEAAADREASGQCPACGPLLGPRGWLRLPDADGQRPHGLADQRQGQRQFGESAPGSL